MREHPWVSIITSFSAELQLTWRKTYYTWGPTCRKEQQFISRNEKVNGKIMSPESKTWQMIMFEKRWWYIWSAWLMTTDRKRRNLGDCWEMQVRRRIEANNSEINARGDVFLPRAHLASGGCLLPPHLYLLICKNVLWEQSEFSKSRVVLHTCLVPAQVTEPKAVVSSNTTIHKRPQRPKPVREE